MQLWIQTQTVSCVLFLCFSFLLTNLNKKQMHRASLWDGVISHAGAVGGVAVSLRQCEDTIKISESSFGSVRHSNAVQR